MLLGAGEYGEGRQEKSTIGGRGTIGLERKNRADERNWVGKPRIGLEADTQEPENKILFVCSNIHGFTFSNHTSCSHTALLFQLLWEGLEIDANETIRLQDEELASLRPAKRFLQIFQHQVPKTSEGIKEQLKHLSQADAPLSLVEFDQLLFTSVYCAYQIRSIQGLDKNLWISFFSQLVDEILHDLCKGFCPANSTLLASWPWKEKPFYLTSLKKSYHSNLAMMKKGTE
uniref:Family with sequence similarity 180 member B n=1 Tax=Chelydra serpentina TaxID=8475 RepID=A0A8C3S2H0_CHESE